MASRRGGVFVPINTEFNNKGLKEANRQLSAFGKSFKSSFVNIGATLGGAFAVGAITDQMGKMISAGSDLAESQSKVGVVFGESAQEIRDWSANSAKSMGLTQQAALEAAGTYGNLFQAFGLGRAEATKMSTSLVQLAADLASFNNTSVDEAIQALRSGLSGETEPLKRFGIAINDARLKQEALNLGIYDGKGILNAAQKAQASYALILKDTTLAQGDYARTASGMANTLRTLSAQLGNLQTEFGTGFLDKFSEMGTAGQSATDVMIALAPALRTAGEAAGEAASGFVKAASALGGIQDELNKPANDQSWWARFTGMTWHILTTDLTQLSQEVFSLKRMDEDGAAAANQSATAHNRYKAALQAQAAASREAANDSADVATGITEVEKKAVKATTAIERLKAQLDRLQGKVSIKRQRLDLADLLDEGPAKSGRRTVMKDGKKTEVAYTTQRDRKRFALDVQEARSDLAFSLFEAGGNNEASRKRARNQFALGRQNVAGLGLGDYTQGLFSVPAELLKANGRAANRVGDYEARKMGTVYIETMNVNVPTVAEAIEQARKAARLQGLGRGQTASAMRYSGMAAAS